jgi:hypothetical protein
VKTPLPRRTPAPRQTAAAALDAHPVPTVVVDSDFRIVLANDGARSLLGAPEGSSLVDALGCVDAREPGKCGETARCGGCNFRRCVERALAGEVARGRGFVLRGSHEGGLGDLHLLAIASPFEHGSAPHAILALYDANALVVDPGVMDVCGGCGRVQDEEGAWLPFHRYVEDRLGLELTGRLCDACERGAPRPG